MGAVVDVEIREGVAVISLNRPEKVNAINQQMGDELYDAMKAVDTHPDVRAVVLTGKGRGFCSGQDLGNDIDLAGDLRLSDTVRERYNTLIVKMQSMRVPLIAAVNGACAGAGFGLALACDLRFAADNAKFTMAFSKIGLAPDSGTSYTLPRLVGYAKALELSWTGEVFGSEQAQAWGIIQRVYPADELLEQTVAVATQLANGPTLAFQLTKEAIQKNQESSLPDALEREARLQDIAGKSADFLEGVRAFTEKRPPNFQGK